MSIDSIDDRLLRKLHKAGYSPRRISQVLGISYRRIYRRLHVLGLKSNSPHCYGYRQKPVVVTMPHRRLCLKCRHPFESAGRHNHVCDPCKASHAWRSGGGFEVSR